MKVLETREVSLAEIAVGDYEVRSAEEDPELPALADSIRKEGLLCALGVVEREGVLHLVHGHRRYSACIMARLSHVRVDILEGDDGAMERASIIENYHRRDVSPVERAAQIDGALQSGSMSIGELAETFHRAEQWVRDQVAVLEWPEDVRAAVHARVVGQGAGSYLAKIEDDGYRGFLLAQAAESGCSERTAQMWLAGWRGMQPAEQVAQMVATPETPGTPRPAPQSMCVGCRSMMRPDGLVPVFICPHCVVKLREGALMVPRLMG